MIIDFHTHIFPEKIAAATIAALLAKLPDGAVAYSDGTLEGLKASMRGAGVDRSVVLPVVTKPQQFEHINEYAAEINGKDGIISFGGIHPDNTEPEQKLQHIKQLGLRGVKLHPDYQRTFIDDPRYIRIISECYRLGLLVSIHAGVDVGMPEVVHCPPQRVVNMLNAVYAHGEPSQANIILAHIGGCDLWDEVESLLVGRPVYFDLSYGLDKIDRAQLLRIINAHGADKILFATDSPWAGQGEYIKLLRELELTARQRELIFHENAEHLFALKR